MTETKIQSHPAITSEHLQRLAVIYVRQSTQFQVRTNTGSTEFQRSYAAVARSYGWPESQIEIIDEDLGKSGSSSQGRTGWQRLQLMIEAKQVGAVFSANIFRLARQVLDFELFRLRAALHNTLLYIDGRFLNLEDSNDTVASQLTAMVAQLENRKRTEVMMQSARSKVRQGQAVSKLPTGWIKGPDDKYDHDPETKDAIRTVIETFWKTRSIRKTVITLANTGVQLLCRKKSGELYFAKPTDTRVRFILTHPAYAGTY